MLMAYIWVGMVVISVLFGAATGNIGAVSTAVMDGAGSAVTLCISICGAVCLWSGIMEVMKQSGLTQSLSGLLRPLLRCIYPSAFHDEQCAQSISANFSANLLGLGNAATPAGISAVRRMQALSGSSSASDEMCRLVVMNTASIQLLPATVAAVRASAGCVNAFDILPCVWISSLVSVMAGLGVSKLLERFSK